MKLCARQGGRAPRSGVPVVPEKSALAAIPLLQHQGASLAWVDVARTALNHALFLLQTGRPAWAGTVGLALGEL